MNTKKESSDKNKELVENLLYNNDITLVSKFIKDLSFEKKRRFSFF